MSTVVVDGSAPARARPLGRVIKRGVIFIIAIGVIVYAADFGRRWWTVGRFIESTDDAYVGGDVTAISPHVAGFVAGVAVTDNQRVSAGELLLRLDNRDMVAALDHSKAIERERRATLLGFEARKLLQTSIIAGADADLDAKGAQSIFALKDADRYNSLANTTAVTRQETERALSLGKAAKAVVASAQASLDGAKQQLAVLEAQIDEAKAEVAQAEADVRTAELNVSYTELRAPVDGYVGNRAARVGMYSTIGTYMLSVVPARGLWVDANFKEDQLAHMRLGDAATIIADVAPDLEIHGHIVSLAPGTGAIFSVIPPENATGNFTKIVQRVPVRIALDADDGALGRLRPGLSTTVSIDTRRAP
ncbi:HlyD family secretion protein [Beijerinckia sp. L45]|uniref:HlyD family secretion protein n=1 Tax=Beijerinckia sp. L45 TaxID=1641855 RepID=UPI00131ECF6A|nr:HlyD family secretion protein [Beijerinckia sp. L45]